MRVFGVCASVCVSVCVCVCEYHEIGSESVLSACVLICKRDYVCVSVRECALVRDRIFVCVCVCVCVVKRD